MSPPSWSSGGGGVHRTCQNPCQIIELWSLLEKCRLDVDRNLACREKISDTLCLTFLVFFANRVSFERTCRGCSVRRVRTESSILTKTMCTFPWRATGSLVNISSDAYLEFRGYVHMKPGKIKSETWIGPQNELCETQQPFILQEDTVFFSPCTRALTSAKWWEQIPGCDNCGLVPGSAGHMAVKMS